MADNNLGPKSNFIPEVIAGVKSTFKNKKYGETDLLNGGDK